jgi:hypothetical protein
MPGGGASPEKTGETRIRSRVDLLVRNGPPVRATIIGRSMAIAARMSATVVPGSTSSSFG